MPVVPSLGQVQEAPLPSPRFSTAVPKVEDVSGGFKAASGIADLAANIAEKEQKSANDAKLIDIDSQLTNFKNDQLWNDKYGAYQQRGENALNVSQTYGDAFNKKVDELYGTLNNDEQRLMFKQRSTQIGNEFKLDLEKHTFTEGKKLEEEKYKLGQETYKQDAGYNYQDPGKVAKNLALTEGLVRSQASKNGISDPELINTLVHDAKSDIHALVIERASNNGQDQFAQAYFNKVKGELGNKLPAVEKTLEEASTLGNAQRARDSIISKSADMTEALAEARKIKEPKIQAKTEDLVKQYYSEQNAAQEQAQKKLFADVINQIDASPLPGAARYDSGVSATQKSNLSPENKKFAQSYAEGKEPPANGERYVTLKQMAVNSDTREQFANTPLDKFQKDMTRAEWKDLFEEQNKIVAKDGTHADLLDYRDQNQKILRDSLDSAGISNPTRWYNPLTWFSGSDGPAMIRYQDRFNQAVDIKQQTLGRKLTAEEASQIANQLSAQIVTSKQSKAIGALDAADISITDIPVDIKNRIAAGRPLTDDQIIKAYIKGLQAGVIKPNAQ